MRNIEALRNYFLGKDPQLEVVLSDNSLRLSGIEGKHYILRGELIKRLTDLREAMEEADETLQANIDAEALARSQEDNALDGKITQEATTRAGADSTLQNAINTVAGNLSTLSNNVYTKAQVDYLINEIPKFDIEIVETLPTQDISETTIYLVPNGDNPLSGNGYEEYIYINNNWELIGTTNIDLSDYYTKEEVDELIESGAVPTIDLKFTDGFTIYNEYIGKVVQIRSYVDHTSTETHEYDGVYVAEEMTGSVKFINLQSKMIYGDLSANTFYWMPGAQGWVPSLDTLIDDNGLVKRLSTPVTIWDLDSGLYWVSAGAEVRYGGGTYFPSSGALLLVTVENSTVKRYFLFTSVGASNGIMNGTTTQNSGTLTYFTIDDECEVTANKVTSISSSSTNTQYPSAKAVYDALPTDFTGTDGSTAGTSGLVPAPVTTDDGKFLCADGTWQEAGGGSNITYGTTDLTPGVSPLDEGSFYFQYE